MADYTQVPLARLDEAVLQALVEEYVSRDGTDYGERELSLTEKVANLRRQLIAGEVCLVFHHPSEQWDLVARERLAELIHD